MDGTPRLETATRTPWPNLGFLRVGSGEELTVFTTVTRGPHLVTQVAYLTLNCPGVIPPGLPGDGGRALARGPEGVQGEDQAIGQTRHLHLPAMLGLAGAS